jgi:hypothetical protein
VKNVIFALLIAIIFVVVSGLFAGATIANISGVIAFFVSLFILNQSSPTGKKLKIILTGISFLALVVIALVVWVLPNFTAH